MTPKTEREHDETVKWSRHLTPEHQIRLKNKAEHSFLCSPALNTVSKHREINGGKYAKEDERNAIIS